MRFTKNLFPAIIICFLNSCVPHRAYVASSYEPLLVGKKKEVQTAFGIRPFKYAYADFTYAARDHLALRLTAGGFFSLANATGSVLYYKNWQRAGIFGGALFNFQDNEIHRAASAVFRHYDYGYSCRYYSPGAVIGFGTNKDKKLSCQLLVKGQYNIVGKYDYNWSESMSGQSGYNNKLYDNESLNHKLNPFLSLEPAFALLVNTKERGYFKFQVGAHFWQKTLQHNYAFNDHADAGNHVAEKTQLHPVSLPVNFTISHIFYHKKSQAADQQ